MRRRDLFYSLLFAGIAPSTSLLGVFESDGDRRKRILREFLSSHEGRAKLAEAMIEPLRRAREMRRPPSSTWMCRGVHG